MKEDICRQLEAAGFSVTEKLIRKTVLWNRRTHGEHTAEELKIYLKEP